MEAIPDLIHSVGRFSLKSHAARAIICQSSLHLKHKVLSNDRYCRIPNAAQVIVPPLARHLCTMLCGISIILGRHPTEPLRTLPTYAASFPQSTVLRRNCTADVAKTLALSCFPAVEVALGLLLSVLLCGCSESELLIVAMRLSFR